MENKRKNHSIVFKGLILVLTLALTLIYLPFGNIMAMVRAAGESTDYTHMTIGFVTDDVQTSVSRGGTYKVAKGFIGGDDNFEIGKVSDGVLFDDTTAANEDVTLKASSVTIKYSSSVLATIEDGVSSSEAVVVATSGDYLASFNATRVGNYTITYSYRYQVGSGANAKTYTNSYDFVVTCELAESEITFVENTKAFLPKVYDMNLAKLAENSYKALELPIPEVYDGDEKQEFDVATSKATATADNTKNYVVVEAFDTNGNAVELTAGAGENQYSISGAYLKEHAGKYTIKYSYYALGEFTTSTTKSVNVRDDEYYKNYKLNLELGSTWTDNGETGKVSKLPTAKGVTASTSTPASESVDVYYSVAVYYKNSGSSYSLIDVDEYNTAAGETIFNDDGTLVNPAEFKPLKDGSYSFVYTIYDAYYKEDASTKAKHTTSTTIGQYEFKNVKDTTDPTPIVYDASTYVAANGYVDASDKLFTRSNPSGVVVYAIGMEDNVSKVGDEGVVLKRTIMTSDTTTVLSITDHNDKNLIFNYEGLAALQANNYLVRKQTATITTENAMIAKLAELGYRIVVDNGNATRLYTLLNEAGYTFDASVTDAATAKTWFKSADADAAGFVFIDTEKTFGAATASDGTGYGQYYIHYIAKDAAGNEKEISKSMYVTTFSDDEKPEITFSSTLSETYLPTATITFNAPTASDNRDTNMKVSVLYRYLDNTNAVVAVAGTETEALTEVFEGLEAQYSKYVLASAEGYINITDTTAETYSIKLNEAGDTATKVQIVAYTYDDMGNVAIYAKEAEIANINDENPLELSRVEKPDVTTFEQGAEIKLPTIEVWDDAAGYLTYDVRVNYIDNEGKETRLSVYDYSSKRTLVAGNFGKLVIDAGSFTAPYQGNYQASIAVRDSANNTIVVFGNYSTTGREVVNPPVINTDFTSKTIELDSDETITIPRPAVNYELADSIDYEDYVDGTSTETYIVRKSWTTNFGTLNEFNPKDYGVGTYDIAYNVTLDIYNRNIFSYNDTWSYTPGVGYTKAGNYTKGSLEFVVEDGAFVVDGFTISKDEDGNIEIVKGDHAYLYNVAEDKYYEEDVEKTADEVFGTSAVKDEDLVEWFAEFRQYNLTSDTYTIKVNDSQGPKISDGTYDYKTIMTKEELSTTGIVIKPIEATDASGINVEKSKIVLSWKRANGTSTGNTGSKTYEGAVAFDTIEPWTATETASVKLDGAYTITYTVYDNNGNYTTKAYTIYVGDNEDPTLKFDSNFVETSYNVGKALTIDLSKIHATDNNEMPADWQDSMKITLINTATGDELEGTKSGDEIRFDAFDQVGTYTLKVEVEDAVGHVASESFSIEVSKETKNSTPVYKIVGIILIVISVLILVGVVVYFIVSKVKLDKELKK